MPEYECIKDAYEKTCDQAVEAYSHISKSNKRKMLNMYDDMFKDMDKLKQLQKKAKWAILFQVMERFINLKINLV